MNAQEQAKKYINIYKSLTHEERIAGLLAALGALIGAKVGVTLEPDLAISCICLSNDEALVKRVNAMRRVRKANDRALEPTIEV
jgi:hypothetical protein